MVDSVPRIPNGYEYGRQSRGRFCSHSICDSSYLFMITSLNKIGINIGYLFLFLAFDPEGEMPPPDLHMWSSKHLIFICP